MSVLYQPLHHGWTFRRADRKTTYPARVPGCVHTDLRAARLIPDPFHGRNELDLQWIGETDWVYATRFDVGEATLREERIDLVAEGLDTLTTIRLNGTEVGRTDNMFLAHRFSVKKLLKPRNNELEIRFGNPMDYIREHNEAPLVPCSNDRVGGRFHIRKQQCSFGWDWGPRFATCGIYRPIRLEAWSINRLTEVASSQHHGAETVRLDLTVLCEKNLGSAEYHATLSFGKKVAAETISHEKAFSLEVENPRLWWSNGLGEQPLYDLEVKLVQDGVVLDTSRQRIALCEVRLDRRPDEWGESFHFTVNGTPVFAKGANWIPTHSFVNEGARYYNDLLSSAVEANMNMIRVWGGGIYEFEEFYDLCLEKGLLVWQDFMFACTPYPARRKDFLATVKTEAEYQVKRLRGYANLALWCGNNELEMMCLKQFREDPDLLREYRLLFYDVLAGAVGTHAPDIAYWPSSPHNPEADGEGKIEAPWNDRMGDVHYWDVWHSREPVENYENQYHRFFSEFGMQAYPHPETAATFTKETNLFGPDMDNHQKNGGGNQTIFDYVSRLYRFPKDYPSTVYLSQINQAHCIRTGIEHMRRNMPRTMGALYWQLNDCWPVASWSSIDFGGRWKALHHAARRFFAPALVSVRRLGSETLHESSNTTFSTIDGAEIYTVFDGPVHTSGKLDWELYQISGRRVILSGQMKVTLHPNQSRLQKTLDLRKEIHRQGREDLVLRTELKLADDPVSTNTTFFTAPKRIEFRRAKIDVSIRRIDDCEFDLSLSSREFCHQVYVNLASGRRHRISDNYFDLYPGHGHRLRLSLTRKTDQQSVEKALRVVSYVDSYHA